MTFLSFKYLLPNKRYPEKEVNVQLLLCLIKQHTMRECKEMDA